MTLKSCFVSNTHQNMLFMYILEQPIMFMYVT